MVLEQIMNPMGDIVVGLFLSVVDMFAEWLAGLLISLLEKGTI